jgi:hypothetical protein
MASIIKVDQIQESTSGVGTNFSNTGSATTPTISIGNQTNKGLYHLATDQIGVAIGGQRVGEIGSGYGGFTGNIIQIQQTVRTIGFNTNSTSYTDVTGLSVTITPRYSTSRVLIILSTYHGMSASTTGQVRLTRNGTPIFENTAGLQDGFLQFNSGSGGSVLLALPHSINFTGLDSPSTTSLLAYTLQTKVGSGTIYIGNNGSNTYTATSTITAMELQQ